MKPCTWDSREKFELLIGPLREVARSKGYALAVHGTLKRDIDLIACPWTRDAVPAKELAEAIRAEAERINGFAVDKDRIGSANPKFFEDGSPGMKPHGRLAWTFHLQPETDGPYVDLSVMPRRTKEVDDGEFLQYVEANRHERTEKTVP